MRVKLIDIATIQLGYQHRGQIEDDRDGSHCIIQIKDIREDLSLAENGLSGITPKGAAGKYLVRKGDILFLSRGRRLYAAQILSDLCDTLAAYYFFILRPKGNEVLSGYAAWQINQPEAQKYLEQQAGDTIIPMVRRSALEALEIDLPALDVQRRILAIEELRKEEQRCLKRIADLRGSLAQRVCQQAARSGNLKFRSDRT